MQESKMEVPDIMIDIYVGKNLEEVEEHMSAIGHGIPSRPYLPIKRIPRDSILVTSWHEAGGLTGWRMEIQITLVVELTLRCQGRAFDPRCPN
jgi:hypothetical protein